MVKKNSTTTRRARRTEAAAPVPSTFNGNDINPADLTVDDSLITNNPSTFVVEESINPATEADATTSITEDNPPTNMDVDTPAALSGESSDDGLSSLSSLAISDGVDDMVVDDSLEKHPTVEIIATNTMPVPPTAKKEMIKQSKQPLSSEEMSAKMSENIATLKRQLYEATNAAILCQVENGNHDSDGEYLEEEKAMTKVKRITKKLIQMEESFKAMFGYTFADSIINKETTSTRVPHNMYIFQWTGKVFDKSRHIFNTPDECCKYFENTLIANVLPVKTNWFRLMHNVLPPELMNWFDRLIKQRPSIDWPEFKATLINQYGISAEDQKEIALSSLFSMKYNPTQHINAYIDNFNQLRTTAEVTDVKTLKLCLLKPLPSELFKHVSIATVDKEDDDQTSLKNAKGDPIDQLIHLLIKTYNILVKEEQHARTINDTHANAPVRSRYYQPPNSDNRQVIAVKSNNNRFKQRYFANKQSSRRRKWCINHHNSSHDTSECRGIGKQRKLSFNNTCNDCGQLRLNKYHKCDAKSRRFKKKHNIVPVNKSPSKSKQDPDDGSDDEQLQFAGADFGPNNTECKLPSVIDDAYFRIPPKDFLSNRFIYLPVILENVKLFCLLDTGSSKSCISLTFSNYLKCAINNKNNGFISLFGDVKLKRIGHTVNELEICYNNKTAYSKLEIVDHLFPNVHGCIGLDTMFDLGITVSNIALTWNDPDLQTDKPHIIDPQPYNPNNDPYFNKEDQAYIMDQLEPYLTANKNIPANKFCTIPGSQIKLPLKHGVVSAYRRQYPINECYISAVNEQIQKWIDSDIVEPAKPNTPFNSPLLTVKKKNAKTGEYTGDIRTVIDSRLVNNSLDLTQVDRFPLPLIADLHRKMSKYTLFTTIDLSQCFHSFRIRRCDRRVTAFTTPDGIQLQFKRAPFGLLPISSVVQRSLTSLFSDLPNTVGFIDDIYVCTNNDITTHIESVKTVISRLTQHNLRINVDKLHIAQKSIYVLGFCLSGQGLILDQRKVANVLDWPTTVDNAKQLSQRLGLINYFHDHIPNLSTLAAPLNKLKNHPNIKTVWTAEHSTAMYKLQRALVDAPVISAPNLKYPFCLVTDASDYGIGGCLYQVIKNTIYYNGFIARTLQPSERKYGSSQRELLAVVYCFKKWRQWLYGRHFTLFVDNKGLLFIHDQRKINRMIENWYESIYEFDFTITYCAGMKNILADALSRLFYPDVEKKLARSDNNNNIKSKNKTIHEKKFQKINSDDAIKNQSNTKLTYDVEINDDETDISDEEITIAASHLNNYKTLEKEEDKVKLIEQCHLLGHYGINSVERVIKDEHGIYWKNLREDITKVIKNCPKCARFNLAKHVYHPPKSICPDGIWDHVAIDLGSFDVSSANGNNFILVIVDLFSRFIVLKAIKSKTALDVATALVSIFSLFGYPKCLTHDNGLEFKNQLLKSITQHMGIESALSLPYTPTGNSVAEASVGSAKRIIMKMLDGYDESWDMHVDGTAYILNQHTSRLHGLKPFEVMFNRQANDLKDYTKDANNIIFSEDTIDINKLKQDINRFNNYLLPEVKEQIKLTQQKDNAYFIKRHRILKEPFPVGATIRIKNIEGKKKKTDALYTDEFTIHGYTEKGSYILKDRLGNIFARNVPTQQIKLVSTNEKADNNTNDEIYEIQAIINHRYKGRNKKLEYLTTWVGYPDEETWLPPSAFNSNDIIKQYWKRRNAGKDEPVATSKRKAESSSNNNSRKRTKSSTKQ